MGPSTTSDLNVAVGHGEDVHKTWDLGHVHSIATLRTFAKKILQREIELENREEDGNSRQALPSRSRVIPSTGCESSG
jgi:hypothetical protein